MYFESACEIFVTETRKTLKPVSTLLAPEIKSEGFDHLQNTPCKFSAKAASFIMKLMYGARMAMPQICDIASRLASQIAKWSADSDRRLLRVHANTDTLLTGMLAKSYRKHLKIIAWPDAELNGDFMSTKSTDGFFVELAGRGGRGFPLAWGSRKQGLMAMHTAEAETVSFAHCCKQELIPLRAYPLPDPPPGHAWGANGLHRDGGQCGLHHRRKEGLTAELATLEEDAAHRIGTSP